MIVLVGSVMCIIDRTHAAQLQRIGNSVNQIAKRVNMTGNIYKEDIAEIKRYMDEIWKVERKLLLYVKGMEN